MNLVEKIYEGIKEFIDVFITKYEYENRGIIKKIRIDSRLNLNIDEEMWSKLFLYKSCYNYCAKIIMLRYLEDNKLTYVKMNKSGFNKWKEFVKNISERFSLLYDVAIMDLQEDKNNTIRNIFKSSDYDLFRIDDELAGLLYKNFSGIDFSNLEVKELISVFRKIYSLEKREDLNLEKFYKRAPAFFYLLRLEENKRIL
ncbi:hypothetical protein [Anaeromicrobium sediminis]|uniref:Uncharacterized protein n=1 Tax=Anaeromicrobium sediminis TaxID=1478221 RepID=A0A267MHN3_9FIRM|nr:hypothetical protein [Anaeromicrobium sediminis]PAB58957.1 hypothetical protein CCE28_12290 [Anaeromicrobium sediminis]